MTERRSIRAACHEGAVGWGLLGAQEKGLGDTPALNNDMQQLMLRFRSLVAYRFFRLR
jgi:hypothetical protein